MKPLAGPQLSCCHDVEAGSGLPLVSAKQSEVLVQGHPVGYQYQHEGMGPVGPGGMPPSTYGGDGDGGSGVGGGVGSGEGGGDGSGDGGGDGDGGSGSGAAGGDG